MSILETGVYKKSNENVKTGEGESIMIVPKSNRNKKFI